ncbi:hypothetical protein KAH27_01155 [bacterium]|nr:hypothetical protein [bacterium]
MINKKRFGKNLPDDVRSIEVKDAEKRKRQSDKKKNKQELLEQSDVCLVFPATKIKIPLNPPLKKGE